MPPTPSLPTTPSLASAALMGAPGSDASWGPSAREAPLLAAFAHARHAPFYRDRLPPLTRVDADTWRAVPLTTKDDLRRAYPFGLLAVPKSRLATYHESSGTSGVPTSSYLTENDWDGISTRFARNAVNLGPGDTVLVKTPYSMVTTAHQMHRAARQRGALVVPADNRSTNMPYARVVRLLRDLPVTVAWCMPTEVALWEAAARLAGLDPRRDFPALRAFLVAGESLSPARRQRLADLWGGTRLYQDYGSTETGSLAGECAEGRLHLWTDQLVFEVIDPVTGAPTGEGAGEGAGQLAVTTLGREAMPLVRYLLEDVVRVSRRPCPCGSPHPTVEVFGRAADVATVQGVGFFPMQLEDAVFTLPESYGVTFWRARHGGDLLEVELNAAPGRGEEAAWELTRLILLRLGISATVRAASDLFNAQELTKETPFLKPRFLFKGHEDWRRGLSY